MASKLFSLAVVGLLATSYGGDTDAYCKATSPLVLSGDDLVSASTLQALIANEEARERMCGRFDGHELFDLALTADRP